MRVAGAAVGEVVPLAGGHDRGRRCRGRRPPRRPRVGDGRAGDLLEPVVARARERVRLERVGQVDLRPGVGVAAMDRADAVGVRQVRQRDAGQAERQQPRPHRAVHQPERARLEEEGSSAVMVAVYPPRG